MRRMIPAVLLMFLFTATSSGQWSTADVDAGAFQIATRAGLVDSFDRIDGYKRQLEGLSDPDARKYIIERIISVTQDELSDYDNADGVLVVATEIDKSDNREYSTRWHGAFRVLEETILWTGEEGLKIYEDEYGGIASRLLKAALSDNDLVQVRDVNRRFGLTKAGREAALHLAKAWFEGGKFSSCARALERVLQNRSLVDAKSQATTSVWLAHCYRELGERASSQKLVSESAVLKDHTIDIAGQQRQLLDVLKEFLSETRDATLDIIDNLGVETVGGNYTNTGLHEEPVDYAKSAWSLTLPRQSATRGTHTIKKYPSLIAPSQLPLFDGNSVYVNNGDSLLAYDLLGTASTMKPAWVCKPFTTEAHNWQSPEPDTALIQTVSAWQGMVFAAIENPLTENHHSKTPENVFGLFSHYPKSKRALCGVDSVTGRVLWKRGGMYEGTFENQTNYLHSIVHNGTLYAIATRLRGQAEIFMYALEPDTGKKKWSIRLCYGQQETTMFGRPAREPITSLPAFAAGHMFLCTNIGGVVAVNLQSRSLSWVSRYRYTSRPVSRGMTTIYRNTSWFNSPTIYTEFDGERYIVVAPADSEYLSVLDAADGTILWQAHRSDPILAGGQALVGARKGYVYVASRSKLVKMHVATGKKARQVVVAVGRQKRVATLAGRPTMTTNSVLWPGWTQSNTSIVEIGLDSMSIIKKTGITRSWGGTGFSTYSQHGIVFNIVGRNYCSGNCKLDVRYDASGLLRKAKAAVVQNPNDPEAALQYGQLAVRLGDQAEGLKFLKHAFKVASEGQQNREVEFKASYALVANYLRSADESILKRRYSEAKAWVQNAHEYALTRTQNTECFLRDERILIMLKDSNMLSELYEKYILEDPDFGIGSDPEISVRIYCQIQQAKRAVNDGNLNRAVTLYQSIQEAPARLAWEGVSLRGYALGHLREIIRANGQELYAQQDRKAAKLLAEGTNAAYENILLYYPISKTADEAVLRLSEHNLKRFAPEIGMKIIRTGLEENPDTGRMYELQAQLAVCLNEYGEFLRARLLASRLIREHPDGKLSIASNVRSFMDVLSPLIESSVDEDIRAVEPRLPTNLVQLWSEPWDSDSGENDSDKLQSKRMVWLFQQKGSADPEHAFLFGIGGGGNSLHAINLKTGKSDWVAHNLDRITRAIPTAQGYLFVLNTGLLMLSFEGEQMWKTTSLGSPRTVDIARGMVIFTNNYFSRKTRSQMVRVTALDALTGSNIWENSVAVRQALWVKQTRSGVLVCGNYKRQSFFLLDYESGRVIHELEHQTANTIYGSPVFEEDTFIFIDQRGVVFEHKIDDLSQQHSWKTGELEPKLFKVVGSKLYIVGNSGATCFDTEKNMVAWKHNNRKSEATIGSYMTRNTLFIVTNLLGEKQVVSGIRVDTGELAFSNEHPRDNQADQLLLRHTIGFDGGLVLFSVVNQIQRGRTKLVSFTCLVFEEDGKIRTSWKRKASSSAVPLTQMIIVDNHIMFTADKALTCLGPKK